MSHLLAQFGQIPVNDNAFDIHSGTASSLGFSITSYISPEALPFVVSGGVFIVAAVMLVLAMRMRAHHRFRREVGLGTRIMLVTMPKEAGIKKSETEHTKTAQEVQQDIATAQLLFSAIGGLKPEHGLKAWWQGRADQFAFEIVSQHGLVSFYIAAPAKYVAYLKQEIHARHPHAQIEETDDYNIFTPHGQVAAAYLKLAKDALYPLKNFKRFEVDPLEVLTGGLAKVPEGSAAAIQYVVRPAQGGWRRRAAGVAVEMQKGKSTKEAIRSYSAKHSLFGIFQSFGGTKKKDGDAAPEARTLSAGEQEAQKLIQEKAAEAGLEINIRVIATANTKEQADIYLNDIVQGFNQYHYYEFGNTISSIAPRNSDSLVRTMIYRSFDPSCVAILSASEMASVFHFPLPTSETPNIRWLTSRKSVPPANLPNEGTVLGKVMYRGVETPVRVKRSDRRRHVYIIGRSGVGKSELMKNMVKQDIENGEGVCIVDPHGDFVEDILGVIPKHRIDDVIVFDPSDTERPVGLNMLEATTEHEKDFATQEMIAIFYKLVTDPSMIGPMFEHYMRNAMLTLMSDSEHPGTIVEIPRILTDKPYQDLKLQTVTDPIIRAFWEKELPQTSSSTKGEMLPYLVSKIGRFIENSMIRNIIGQEKSGFNLREVMDGKKILLANLAKGKIGEMNSNLLGLILVSKLQMAAMRRADLPEDQRHDFYLYIDEFQNFITDSIATILSEARKYRLDLVVAHQYLGQLVQGQDTKVRDAVLGNAGTMAVFRIGVEDAEVLAKEFAPTFNEYDLVNTEKYTAYVKLLVDNTGTRPFNMNAPPPFQTNRELASMIKELSRLKYGRDKATVEAEILERSKLA